VTRDAVLPSAQWWSRRLPGFLAFFLSATGEDGVLHSLYPLAKMAQQLQGGHGVGIGRTVQCRRARRVGARLGALQSADLEPMTTGTPTTRPWLPSLEPQC
jgi:hypothetical protein